MLHLDFESRSRVDLIASGEYNYWSDHSTEVLLVGWAIDDEPAQLWASGDPMPPALRHYLEGDDTIHAHNARFERLGYEYYIRGVLMLDLPPIAPHRWRCTMAQARANGLPAALDDAAFALGTTHRKDPRGKELIKLLSVPQADGTFLEDRKLFAEFGRYCLQDVEVERAIGRVMRSLTPDEHADYVINERICDRGIQIDPELCMAAAGYAKAEEESLRQEIVQLTDGAVTTVRGEGLKAWVLPRLRIYQLALITSTHARATKVSLDRDARVKLLECDDLDDLAAQVLQVSDDAQASSVSKFSAMHNRADPEDWRVRGAIVLNGAPQTGRYSSTGAQVHNISRKTARDPENIRTLMMAGAEIPAPVMHTLRSMLRPAIVAPAGHVLIGADWAAIEGRVLPWLAADADADYKLDLFERGADIYLDSASRIYRDKVTAGDPRRQVGKVAELALGYGGGKGAFLTMARNYGLRVSTDEAESIKRLWRETNPWAPRFWAALEKAAIAAVRHPNGAHHAGQVSYCSDGWTLWCLLPSGRLIGYPGAAVKVAPGRFGDEIQLSCIKGSIKPKAGATEWPRVKLWGGVLAENITQGTAACLLRHALRELERDTAGAGYVVLHVHDEIVLEVPQRHAGAAEARLLRVMQTPPDWADGLPLAAKAWRGERFGK